MSNLTVAHAKAQRASVHAVITRADGRVQNLGIIAYYHRNPVWRWIVNALISTRRRLTG